MRFPGIGRRPVQLVLFGAVLALAVYVCGLAVAYYLHLRSVQRHHLESAWMWFIASLLLAALTATPAVDEDRGPSPVVPTTTVLLAVIAAAILLYYPALRLGFLSDDFVLSAMAARGEFFGQSWAFFRPLPLLFYQAAGAHPAALHALVITLHGLNAGLVCWLAVIVGLSRRQAMTAAALFLTFPANLEAVAWCAGVQDVMMTAGVLGSIVAASSSATAISLAAMVAALLSKETAVAAPFLMWLSNRAGWRTPAMALAIASAYAAWRITTRSLAEGFVAVPTSYKLKELLVRPYGTLAVPFRGAQLTASPWLGILLVCGLAVLLVRAAWLWRGNLPRILMVGTLALWVIVSIAPVYSMFDVSGTLQGSRYVYLATAGWSMLMAALLLPARSRLDLLWVVAALTIGAVGLRVNFVPWTRAAATRDEALSAVERAKISGCNEVWIRNVPDSVQGADVFRNGLPEALAPTVVSSAAPPSCWISVALPSWH
jgi:hypothetical protein